MSNKKVCIIVPHGDDEVLGFGGIIQKYKKQNMEVDVVFCRSPIDDRTNKQFQDIERAKNILYYDNAHFLYVTEAEISNQPLVLFRKIEKVLRDIKPDIVYTTFWGDIHQDHRITFDCVSRAVRVWGGLAVKEFYVGEIPSSTDQYPTITGTSFTPNHYVKLNTQEVEKKINALMCYAGEVHNAPHPRSSGMLYNKMKLRGSECGSEYAEAFISIRTII